MKLEKLHQVAAFSRDLDETRVFYEEWMAFFKDPSGNTLVLATQRPPA